MTQTTAWCLPEGRAVGEVEEGVGETKVGGRRLDLGCCTHHTINTQMIQSCTPEPYIALSTNVTPINVFRKVSKRPLHSTLATPLSSNS